MAKQTSIAVDDMSSMGDERHEYISDLAQLVKLSFDKQDTLLTGEDNHAKQVMESVNDALNVIQNTPENVAALVVLVVRMEKDENGVTSTVINGTQAGNAPALALAHEALKDGRKNAENAIKHGTLAAEVKMLTIKQHLAGERDCQADDEDTPETRH